MTIKPIEIGSKVEICDEGILGVVTGVMLEQEGTQYRVVYWADGVRNCAWVHGFEIRVRVPA